MGPIRTTLASILAIIFAFALVFGISNDTFAQGYRKGADACTGACNNGLDEDGDGIPNGQDEDYVPPRDGTGKKAGKGDGKRANRHNIENGDCNCGNDDRVLAKDGTGNRYGKGKASRALRGKFRSYSWGRMRAGNGEHLHAAPALSSGHHLRKHSRRAFIGTQDGIGKQMRFRRGRR